MKKNSYYGGYYEDRKLDTGFRSFIFKKPLFFQDPLLLVPRNDGACLWAPAVPFSTVPACTTNTSSFSCHLHTNNAFTLERSKSDVQTHRHLKNEYNSKTTFYVSDHSDHEETKETQSYALGKSKTSAFFTNNLNTVDISIFDNRPVYSRTAPSPPVRTKLSPGSRRVELNKEVKTFTDQGKNLGQLGILDVAPIPPKRKISPRSLDNSSKASNCVSTDTLSDKDTTSEDLIKF